MRKVSLSDRIRELAPDLEMDEGTTVMYTWESGYEKLVVKRQGGGGCEYVGCYHPNTVCEGNPCRYCGWARPE